MKQVYPNHVEGYPTFIVWDGCAYCPDCANEFAEDENNGLVFTDCREEDRLIFSVPDESGITQAINWESEGLYCDRCSEDIPCAYPSD